MIVLTAYATLLPDKLEQALDACRTVRLHSVREPGCERYDFFMSPDHPGRVVFVEEWTSRAHLNEHFEREAFQQFFATIADMLADRPEIRVFESTLLEE